MLKFITGRISVKVAIIVNIFIFIVIAAGTYILIAKQSNSLEEELLSRGKIQSIVGAKMIGQLIDEAIDNGVFSVKDAFDTNYQKFGNFKPPKYHTLYDSYLDKAILGLQDEFLLDKSIVFAVTVDKNGYLPTHNTRYQKPITGDVEKDKIGNRTKRIFNDPVGLKAATNTTKGFLQIYHRDTGVTMWDISSPVYVKGKHWGAFRIGLSLKVIQAAQSNLRFTLLSIMTTILILSLSLIFIIVSRFLAPVKALSDIANSLAKGERLEEEILITSQDEIGELQRAIDRLRISMVLAMRRIKKQS